ncbi:hypothetical protein MAHJHV35_48130 [Mycobacterium avium subsp. hominissuis]
MIDGLPEAAGVQLRVGQQLHARGFWETVDHPVDGSFLCTGMPFAFLGKPRRWLRRGLPRNAKGIPVHRKEPATG